MNDLDRAVGRMSISDTVMVPREPTPEMLNAAIDVDAFKLGDISPLGFRISPQALFERCWSAMLAASPQQSPAGDGAEICDRLEDLLSGNDKFHPVGCAEWDERARVAIDMAKDFILAGQQSPISGEGWPVHVFVGSGDLEAQREQARRSETYKRGDTVLVWVNEGDLYANPNVILEQAAPPVPSVSGGGRTMREDGSFSQEAKIPTALVARLEVETYEPGGTYDLSALSDVFALYCWLPEDRAALFLDEITAGLRLGAASIKLMSLVIGFADATASVTAQPFRWTDDDKGDGQIAFKTEDDAELVSFNYERATTPGKPSSASEGVG